MKHEEFWKKFPPIPGFDCIQMKREIQAKFYEATRDMSPKELVDYLEQRAWERQAEAAQSGAMIAREDPSPYGNEQA